MARIASIATAVPQFVVPLEVTRRRAAEVFGPANRGAAHIMALIDRSGVDQRHFVVSVDDIVLERTLDVKSKQYREHAIALAMEVVPAALERAGLRAQDVDHIFTVSCTGLMIPSLDAELMNLLPFRRDCRRTPITELGCAAGAVGLSRAHDHVLAHPGETALLVAVEISSLTFQSGDRSMTNVVASAIFGDGAAAAVVTGRPGPGCEILETRSELFPETQYIMGFDLRDGGLHIKLDRDLAPLLERELSGVLERFLAPRRIKPSDLRFFALHPGGRKLLEVMQERLGVGREATFASWDILRENGNMSSATVLFVLERTLRDATPAPGSLGLLAAFGPGFSAETLLLQWR